MTQLHSRGLDSWARQAMLGMVIHQLNKMRESCLQGAALPAPGVAPWSGFRDGGTRAD